MIRRLHADRSAQGLVFSAILLFVLASFLLYTADFLMMLEAKVRHQGASDAAAYSACLVRAEALATVAAMNHVLVWLARAALGLVGAVTALAALSVVNPAVLPLFSRALAAAVEWLPRLRSWSDRIAKAEDRLAALAPALAAAEADRIARANGAARGVALPFSRLPLIKEPDLPRYAGRVTGGLIPASLFSRFYGGASAGDDLGSAAKNASDRARLGRFRELLRDAARNPWPLPRVLDRRFCQESLTVAAFPGTKPFRFPLPFLASARPFHPDLPCPGVEGSPDNLYLIEGWSAELVPVDLKALAPLGLDRAAFGMLEH